MKSITTKKALDRAVERAMKAHYLVDTGVVGTVNMVLLQVGDESYCETWSTGDDVDSGKHGRFQAFGDHQSGEVLISSFGDQKSLHLIGKGNQEHGILLLIQRTGDVFTVVWNSDVPADKAVFFMTATSDSILVQLIGMLAEKYFTSINNSDLQNAVAMLIGGDSDD
ncbi:hypothetical protein [uncultured Succiniclasticum sp.]|uniref:hypothetical protein n=1 Tax=uncultured Succiniclasticum sp. TaxID=1500547 RepID=UPI0025F683AC|nr:hypothetical protein [uncultured Succiniclasticum sp.]